MTAWLMARVAEVTGDWVDRCPHGWWMACRVVPAAKLVSKDATRDATLEDARLGPKSQDRP